MRFLKFMFIMLLQAVKTVNWAENTICDTCGLNSRTYDIFEVLALTVVISRKMVKWAQNTICDACALNSRRYEIFEVFAHNVVISRKTVKWAENTICVTSTLNSLIYDIFEVLVLTIVITRKTVKSAWEHDLWYLCTQLPEIWHFESFYSYSCKQAVKQSNGLKTRFVILVHWTPGDMRFLKF